MDRKLKLVWWGLLGILLVVAAVKLLLPVKSPSNVELVQDSREVVVYVTGAVENIGLFHLPLDSRLDDVLQLAVPTPDADREALNPAQRLKDGQKIIVPFKVTDIVLNSVPGTCGSDTQIQSVIKSPDSQSKVNINTAGLAELDNIPGIGPALAERIIDYREQYGLFSSSEEIQNVSGIGPKTYEKMASHITVGF